MSSRRKISYVERTDTVPGGERVPVFTKVEVSNLYTRTYHDAIDRLVLLTPCARNLVDYLCMVMDSGNIVQNNAVRRRTFRWRMAKLGVDYKDGTVKNAFLELVDGGLLLDMGRGSYRLNPVYFMKNGGRGRIELIKQVYDNKK